MANSITHAALPYPIKGCRFTLLIPYLDADGDPTDPTTPDTERSIDGAAYADCTEEVTTITGSNGSGYITLTGDEMNASAVMVAAKVASGPKATIATLYPRVLPVLHSGTAQAGAAGTITLASGAAAIDDLYNGCIIRTTGGTGGAGGSGSQGNQARVVVDYNGSTKVATISPSWETNPDSTTTYEVLQAETALFTFANLVQISGAAVATGSAQLGVNVVNFGGSAGTFASGRPDVNTTHIAGSAVSTSSAQIGVNVVQVSGDATAADNLEAAADGTGYNLGGGAVVAASVTGAVGSVTGSTGSIASGGISAGSFAAGAIDAAAIAANAIGASELAADAAAEMATAVRSELTTELGRIDVAVSTRLATAGYTSPPSAATIAAAVWDYLTSAATTVGSLGKLLVDNVNATISSRLASASYTAAPTAAQNATELLDQAAGVETNRTVRQALRLMLAALGGKLSGAATTTVAIRDTNDSKDRITATVDADGNRTAVTYDAS